MSPDHHLEAQTSAETTLPFNLATTIVLRSGFTAGDDFAIAALRSQGISADVSLRPIRWKALRALRRLHLHSPLPGKSVWFGDWLRSGERKQLVIVHAADLTLPAAQHATRRFPGARVIFWFWNPAARGTDPERARDKGLELWSFDENDCTRYDMRHNTQFSFAQIAAIGERISPDVDLGFFGADKGRAEQLTALAKYAQTTGLSYRFQVVPGAASQLDLHPLLTPATPLPYELLLQETARARIVVDIAQHGQTGMTLRTLESLYLKRKLLTNIRSVRTSPLYDPTRVFILGEDDIARLGDFLHTEPTAPSSELWNHYDVNCWLRRF